MPSFGPYNIHKRHKENFINNPIIVDEAVLGRKLETTGSEVLKTVHPHPTMSEAVMEAVADAYDEVIHL